MSDVLTLLAWMTLFGLLLLLSMTVVAAWQMYKESRDRDKD